VAGGMVGRDGTRSSLEGGSVLLFEWEVVKKACEALQGGAIKSNWQCFDTLSES